MNLLIVQMNPSKHSLLQSYEWNPTKKCKVSTKSSKKIAHGKLSNLRNNIRTPLDQKITHSSYWYSIMVNYVVSFEKLILTLFLLKYVEICFADPLSGGHGPLWSADHPLRNTGIKYGIFVIFLIEINLDCNQIIYFCTNKLKRLHQSCFRREIYQLLLGITLYR